MNILNKMTGYWAFGDISDALGAGVLAEACSFSDACDAYSDHRDKDRDAKVYRFDASIGFIDVTADADQIIIERMVARNADLPDWLTEDV